MITVAVHKKSQQVLVEVPKQALRHREGIAQAFFEIGSEVVRETKRLIETGNKTGRIYRIRGRFHQASAPGEAPANLSGRLARSGDYKVNGLFLRVGETVNYAKFLEDGTRKMAPRPHLLKAVNNEARNTQRSLQEYALNRIGYK